MSARDEVLASIRRSLGVSGREATRRLSVETRLATAPRGVIPQRGQVDREARIALMADRAKAAHATVTVLDAMEAVPSEVARFLRDANAPATLRMGDDPQLAALPWADTALTVETGRSHGADLNAVSRAFGAVAESGTLALVSGTDNPTTLNFLPDNHVVVVRADDVAGDYETVFSRLRDSHGTGMPRTLNFITGPSRSGDIEQTLVLGAHGPRRLHVVIVR
ncbi:LutC/YkgG family protein [Lichenifustis flavocetrariae]|uniref:Lactate utilization protein n=1 Tax=Lichenifustis flavocetrariae TaxID=2949735 RepID=A0AA41YYR1_9HYPH|nr:lactate utilization protein [Lichenifustis flavocetrariae]MCW6509553.1 lactate utilization protein [Lichenifustis flavocetrariae]